MSLPEDQKGYVDRQCPSKQCKSFYKAFGPDWDQKVDKKRAFCPLCRHEAPADQWATQAQREYVKAVGMREMKKRVRNALESGVRSFSRRPQSGFITLSLSLTPDTKPVHLPVAVGGDYGTILHL